MMMMMIAFLNTTSLPQEYFLVHAYKTSIKYCLESKSNGVIRIRFKHKGIIKTTNRKSLLIDFNIPSVFFIKICAIYSRNKRPERTTRLSKRITVIEYYFKSLTVVIGFLISLLSLAIFVSRHIVGCYRPTSITRFPPEDVVHDPVTSRPPPRALSNLFLTHYPANY